MATQNVIDYKGLGPFLPFGVLERMVRDMGTVTVAVDPGVESLLARWASRRGYYARVGDGTVIVSVAPIEVAEERPGARRGAEQAAPAAAAVGAVELRVDEKNWRSDIAEKLADVTFIIGTVLRAPIVYRGPAQGPGFASAVSSKGGVLIRVSLNAQDYFIFVSEGRVLAAAQIGRPLTPGQAKSIVEQLGKNPDTLVTIYDASKMF